MNLYNESEAAEGCYFNLSIVDAANQKGAKFSIDGVPLADKRGILVDYGEVLQKTLEIRRGTEYDYEDLAIVLSSQCQADRLPGNHCRHSLHLRPLHPVVFRHQHQKPDRQVDTEYQLAERFD